MPWGESRTRLPVETPAAGLLSIREAPHQTFRLTPRSISRSSRSTACTSCRFCKGKARCAWASPLLGSARPPEAEALHPLPEAASCSPSSDPPDGGTVLPADRRACSSYSSTGTSTRTAPTRRLGVVVTDPLRGILQESDEDCIVQACGPRRYHTTGSWNTANSCPPHAHDDFAAIGYLVAQANGPRP